MGLKLSADFISRPLAIALAAAPAGAWESLRGSRFLITGATGFFGGWTLAALAWLNDELSLGIKARCVSRDPRSFLERRPDLAERSDFSWAPLRYWREALSLAEFDATHVLHMAASSDARDYEQHPGPSFLSILDGARFAIDAARQTQAHLHFVSSGAVYGPRRLSDGPCLEEQITRFAPNPLDSAQPYANAKRAAEALIACSSTNWSISRPFAFLGPGLPLDQHFAAGNFIQDAALGRPITLSGDGSPIRSYMHPADLAAWTLALCSLRRQGLALNVGSNQPLSIKDLADRVSASAGSASPGIKFGAPGSNPSAYWPGTDVASALGLRQSLDLNDCILDALTWANSKA